MTAQCNKLVAGVGELIRSVVSIIERGTYPLNVIGVGPHTFMYIVTVQQYAEHHNDNNQDGVRKIPTLQIFCISLCFINHDQCLIAKSQFRFRSLQKHYIKFWTSFLSFLQINI
jgi:hypothetical protein